MITLVLGSFVVCVLCQAILSDRELRLWVTLSFIFLINYAFYQKGGVDDMVGGVPLSILLLWFVYMDLKK